MPASELGIVSNPNSNYLSPQETIADRAPKKATDCPGLIPDMEVIFNAEHDILATVVQAKCVVL